jgi:DNA-binding MltR family transcriptional regulator
MSNDLQNTLLKHIQAANVLVVAGQIEDTLEKLLLTAGRTVSNKFAKRLFAGMGPLHSLSGKIEIAYFFELIDQEAFDDLQAVKDIRNRFAHTTRYVYFTDPVIVEKCRILSTWEEGGHNAELAFNLCTLHLIDDLRGKMDVLIFERSLKEEPPLHLDDD